MQIIINAGGTGTRLWPISTSQKPKQFVPLIDEESFLSKTYNRLISTFEAEQIWVNTNQKFKQQVIDNLPQNFDQSHILLEPQKRDNFAAIICHAAVVAHNVGREESLLFLHADHLIRQEDWPKFNQALQIISSALQAKQFEIITAAVKPSFANTQLGYIEIVPQNSDLVFEKAIKVEKFKEKPDLETAESFLAQGNFLWNLGYFSFTFENLIKNLTEFWPEVVPIIERIYQLGKIEASEYEKLPKIAFDYAVAEKTNSLGVIGIDIFWEDIGSWDTVVKYLPPIAQNSNQLELDGSNNKVKLAHPNRKVAFVGVSDLLLVETEEGLLIIDPKKAKSVKQVAEYFEGK